MNIRFRIPILLGIVITIPSFLFAQNDTTDIYNLSFTELAKLKITSASKVAQAISEVPHTVHIITAREIRQRGYFTLDDVLSDLPGFQFRNIQSINSYIFQRGIPNQNNLTLVLIDGIQVNELNSGGFYAGGQYNLSNVDRIEVIQGPSSVAYGTNAVSGIINIITKPAEEQRMAVSTLAGSFQTFSSDFSIASSHPTRPFSLALSGMAKTTAKANLRGKEGDHNWTDLMDNFERNYAFDLRLQAGKFTVGSNYMQKQASGSAYISSMNTPYKDHGTLWNIRFMNNYIRYDSPMSGKLSVSSVAYNRNATVLPNSVLYISDAEQIGYYRPNHLFGWENTVDFTINNYLGLSGGLVFEYEQIAETYSESRSGSPYVRPDPPPKPDMLGNTLASIYLEPRLNVLSDLYFSGGVRFDQSSFYGQVFTPRAGVIYRLKDHILRLSYAEAFRAPRPWDYTDGLGNTELMPERMHSFEGGLGFLLLEGLKADIVLYNNKLNNSITRQDLDDDYRWVNRGSVTIKGFEFGLRHISARFQTYVNYTYNDSRDEHGDAIPEISLHAANGGITFLFSEHVHFHLRANYAGERENPKFIRTTSSMFVDPYTVFHGSISYHHASGLGMQLVARNVFDKEYYHTSNRQPDRYRQSQRTILLVVSYKLPSL